MGINKFNAKGCYDTTVHDAFVNIQREERASCVATQIRIPSFRPIVFICSPYGDGLINNERRAIRYCQLAVRRGCIPIVPYSYFTRFLDERFSVEWELGLFMGQVMLTKCVEVCVFSDRVSLVWNERSVK